MTGGREEFKFCTTPSDNRKKGKKQNPAKTTISYRPRSFTTEIGRGRKRGKRKKEKSFVKPFLPSEEERKKKAAFFFCWLLYSAVLRKGEKKKSSAGLMEAHFCVALRGDTEV